MMLTLTYRTLQLTFFKIFVWSIITCIYLSCKKKINWILAIILTIQIYIRWVSFYSSFFFHIFYLLMFFSLIHFFISIIKNLKQFSIINFYNITIIYINKNNFTIFLYYYCYQSYFLSSLLHFLKYYHKEDPCLSYKYINIICISVFKKFYKF